VTRVSVAIAVRDVAPWIDEALDSVLAQVGPDDEVVVVDDGSTDATPDLLAARGAAITVLRPGTIGLSAARNLSIEQSRGRYVGFIDGDDRWAPGALDVLVAVLEDHPDVDLVLGRTDEFLDPSITDAATSGLRAPKTDQLAWFVGALLARREVVDAVRFDEQQPLALVSDWLARVREHGVTVHEVPEVILQRRLRTGSMTSDGAGYRDAMLRSLRANLRRSRAG
jgi:glycosyltransferase involved in cell wall biosynthesis